MPPWRRSNSTSNAAESPAATASSNSSSLCVSIDSISGGRRPAEYLIEPPLGVYAVRRNSSRKISELPGGPRPPGYSVIESADMIRRVNGIHLARTTGISAISMLAVCLACFRAGVAAQHKQVADLLAPIRERYNLPALAGAVLTSRGLVEIGAVGVRKAGTDVPVTDRDEWHLGSDTKAMTATIIASLVERGKLAWDVTMGQMFPEVAKSMDPELRRVTLLQLLSHRAGLPHDANWGQASRSGPLREQREAVVRMVVSMKPLYPPGSKYQYSNLGYVLAGIMAEKVTNTAWEDLITRMLFEPLGMSHAG